MGGAPGLGNGLPQETAFCRKRPSVGNSLHWETVETLLQHPSRKKDCAAGKRCGRELTSTRKPRSVRNGLWKETVQPVQPQLGLHYLFLLTLSDTVGGFFLYTAWHVLVLSLHVRHGFRLFWQECETCSSTFRLLSFRGVLAGPQRVWPPTHSTRAHASRAGTLHTFLAAALQQSES